MNTLSVTTFPFAKVVPGGNPTILLPADAVPPSQLAQAAQALMGEGHIHAEQVGSLTFPTTGTTSLHQHGTLPHLQMMGGEFCVNATRASAALLGNANQLACDEAGCCAGYMTVSGVDSPILVATAPTETLLSSTIAQLQNFNDDTPEKPKRTKQNSPQLLPSDQILSSQEPAQQTPSGPAHTSQICPDKNPTPADENVCALPPSFLPARSPVSGWNNDISHPVMYSGARLTLAIAPGTFETVDDGMVIVHLPGISHLLIPVSSDVMTTPMPSRMSSCMPKSSQCEELAARYRARYQLDTLPACGTIWYERHSRSFSIVPAVYVKNTDTLCLETACGSASLALGLHTCLASGHYETQPASTYAIQQPSGHILTVTITPCSETSCHAWVAGITHITATGTAYL